MPTIRFNLAGIAVLLLGLAATDSQAQQVTVGAPFHNSSGGFFEHFGVNFGFRQSSPNGWMFFNNGNSMSALPPFGFDPSSASTFGVGGRKGDFEWNLGFTGSQGYTQSNVSTVPSLTLPSGGFGFVNNTVQRPFVVGFMPVVNGEPQAHRMNRRLQYERAAETIVSEGLSRDAEDEAEFAALRVRAKADASKARPKRSDPPLILGYPK